MKKQNANTQKIVKAVKKPEQGIKPLKKVVKKVKDPNQITVRQVGRNASIITIPVHITKKLRIKKGTKLNASIVEKTLVLSK